MSMKSPVQKRLRAPRPPSLLEWNRWFGWYPVLLMIDGRLHYAWLRTVERKWGTSAYSGTIKWNSSAVTVGNRNWLGMRENDAIIASRDLRGSVHA
jgi:hypothetical protein